MKRNAIITGSTSGIGLGIARQLAASGYDIALNGLGDASNIEDLRSELAEQYQVKVVYAGADLSKPAGAQEMITTARSQLGGHFDILVNNAGIQHVDSIPNFPDQKWEQVLAINLSAVFYGTKAVLPVMIERKWGRVINVASVHGLVASPNKSAYVAAKHGVVGLTKVTALECAQTGVTANAICPGWVLTPLVQKQITARAAADGRSFEEAKTSFLEEKQPSMEFVTPEQLGDLVVFLCSDSASQLTGQALAVDGGWVAR